MSHLPDLRCCLKVTRVFMVFCFSSQQRYLNPHPVSHNSGFDSQIWLLIFFVGLYWHFFPHWNKKNPCKTFPVTSCCAIQPDDRGRSEPFIFHSQDVKVRRITLYKGLQEEQTEKNIWMRRRVWLEAKCVWSVLGPHLPLPPSGSWCPCHRQRCKVTARVASTSG